MTTIIDFSGSGRGRVISAVTGMTESQALGFLDQGAQLVTDAQTSADAAAQSAADADAAVLLAQQAQAASLEVPDNNVSALVGNPATDTRAALDGYIADGVTITLTAYASPSPTTDHTAAIGAALTAGAALAPRRTVLVPPGQWNFTSLSIPSGVTLQGAGGVLRLMDGTATDPATDYYPILIPAGTVNAGVVGVTVDANNANNTSGRVCDTITAAGDNIRIEGNTLINVVDSGVMFSRVTHSTCSGNRISGGRDVGIYVNDGAGGTAFSDNHVDGNIISGFPYGGIALKRSASKATVCNNVIHDCGNGITLEQASTATDYSTDVTISGNRLRNIGQNNPTPSASVGINLRGSDNCIVSDNRLDGLTGRGVYVDGSSQSSITGNVVTFDPAASTATGYGIYVGERANVGGSRRLSVVGNVITGSPSNGIRLAGSATQPQSNISIGQNIVTGAGGAALRIDAHNSGVSIVGNTFGGAVDVTVYAGADYFASSNVLATGVTSGAWAQLQMGPDGSLPVGNQDTVITRIAAAVIGVPQVRSSSTVHAFFGAAHSAAMGTVGIGNVGLRLSDAILYQNGPKSLRTDSSLTVDGGVVLKSPNGTSYMLVVSDAGALSTEPA